MRTSANAHRGGRRGTALIMAILLSVVITGLIVSLAVVSGTQNLAAANAIRRISRLLCRPGRSRAGLLEFQEQHQLSRSAASPLTGSLTMGNGVYSYSVTCIGAGTTVQIVSVAKLSTVNGATPSGPTIGSTYQLSAVGQSYVPELYTNNVLDDSAKGGTWTGPINVVGDVYVAKDINMAGTQALSVTGNIVYGGKETGTNFSYTGTNTAGTPSVTVPNYATIEAHAVNPSGTAATPNMTINFTTISGSNPTYYVTGNLTDPTFIGSGTVIVDGPGAGVTFDTATVSVGSASSPVYIITSARDYPDWGSQRCNHQLHHLWGTLFRQGLEYDLRVKHVRAD